MRIAIAALLAIAAGSFAGTAQADPYRWCADYGSGRGGLGATNCYFVTLEQCRAAASQASAATAEPNPFYDGVPVDGPPARRAKKKRQTS